MNIDKLIDVVAKKINELDPYTVILLVIISILFYFLYMNQRTQKKKIEKYEQVNSNEYTKKLITNFETIQDEITKINTKVEEISRLITENKYQQKNLQSDILLSIAELKTSVVSLSKDLNYLFDMFRFLYTQNINRNISKNTEFFVQNDDNINF